MVRTSLGSRYVVTAFRHGGAFAAFVVDLQLSKTHGLRIRHSEYEAVVAALGAAKLDRMTNAGEWEIHRPGGLD